MKKTVILLLFLAAGCSFLDEHPRDQKQREEVITSEATLYLNTLGHLYGMIGSNEMGEGLAGTYRGVYDLNTFTTDEAMLPTRSGDWYDGGLWQRLYLHTWETGEEPVKNAWNYLYKVIVMANQAIVDLKDYPAWKQEARALRAMYYYYLLDLFGRVPIVTSPDIAMADVAQSSRADVFRFVVQELEEVVPDLALEKSNLPGMYYGRITRPVAWFLLAKLVSSLGYDLEHDYSANFAVYNEASVENIFVIPMDKHLYSAENQYLFRSRHYDHAAAIGFVGENGSSATLEALQVNGFGTAWEDPRFRINYWGGVPTDLNGNDIDLEYKPLSVALDVTGTPDEKIAGARMNKYEIDPKAMDCGKLMDNDWVVFRYADVLLMRAEALLHKGDKAGALTLVNAVRDRAMAAPFTDLTYDILLDERMREFAWEGLRRQDLIRFGAFGKEWSFRRPLPGEEATGFTNVFPIPADILALNPKLSQNEGY